jgi:hydroxymethylglutaryl-CoA synthase
MGDRNMNDSGILAMEVYFPRTYVKQTELEKFDNASAGKYTSGLGQHNMAFFTDREDINSIALTAVKSLLEKYAINPKDIGRLEVGTETLLDKSKSVKTQLMRLFAESGNGNIEGVDTMNACYGGTNALFNALQWIDSRHWDGRYAIVVAGDIAVYAVGNARPTGGGGCVAMLLGKGSCISIEPGLRGSHFEHAYDFYKPNPHSEYPTVDGHLSVGCYYRALDHCYAAYKAAVKQQTGRDFTFNDIEYMCLHSPYSKLVQKAFGRLLYNDFLASPDAPQFADCQQFRSLSLEKSYTDKDLEAFFVKKTQAAYDQKVSPGAFLARELGNLYCGSVYSSLAALVADKGDRLIGKRVMLFSYGSGLASSLFSFKVTASLIGLSDKLDVKARLAARIAVPPAEFARILKLREERYGKAGFAPSEPVDDLFPGTFYLTEVDNLYRRSYARIPPKGPSAL